MIKKNLPPFFRFLFTMVLILPLAWFDQWPYGKVENKSLLRLAWRLNQDPIKLCRPYTPEELAKLPIHMRLGEACEKLLLSYDLNISLNGQASWHQPIEAAGIKEDRPLVVFHDFEIPPGASHIKLHFAPLTKNPVPHFDQLTESQQQVVQEYLKNAPTYLLEQNFNLQPGEIALVRMNEKMQQLEILETR